MENTKDEKDLTKEIERLKLSLQLAQSKIKEKKQELDNVKASLQKFKKENEELNKDFEKAKEYNVKWDKEYHAETTRLNNIITNLEERNIILSTNATVHSVTDDELSEARTTNEIYANTITELQNQVKKWMKMYQEKGRKKKKIKISDLTDKQLEEQFVNLLKEINDARDRATKGKKRARELYCPIVQELEQRRTVLAHELECRGVIALATRQVTLGKYDSEAQQLDNLDRLEEQLVK